MTELAIAISIYLLIPIALFMAIFWTGSIIVSFFYRSLGGDK